MPRQAWNDDPVKVDVSDATPLAFPDGRPVRGASAIAAFGSGWLVAQDDATHAAWLRDDEVTAIRVLPAVDGHEHFSDESGTKHLKPDLEAAVAVDGAVLLLGSGSRSARMRSVLVDPSGAAPIVTELGVLYAFVGIALDVDAEKLNLEGACVVDGALRWFQRGLPAAGPPTASVDLDLADLVKACRGELDPARVRIGGVRRYALDSPAHDALAITDAVALPDGRVLVSAAEEDTVNPYDDGPVLGAALALLDDRTVSAVATVPPVDGAVAKIEGLAILDWSGSNGRLLATVDGDDPRTPALLLTLDVRL